MLNRKKIEAIAKRLEQEVIESAKVQKISKKAKTIPLDDVKLIKIIVYPDKSKLNSSIKAAKSITANPKNEPGPAYSLSKIEQEIEANRIDFRTGRGKDCNPEGNGLTKDKSIEIIKSLKPSDYQCTKAPLPTGKNPGDDLSADVYKKLVNTEEGPVNYYIKFCKDDKGVLVISFHPDSPKKRRRKQK